MEVREPSAMFSLHQAQSVCWLGVLQLLVTCRIAHGKATGPDIGTFWQLTDVHYDANYSETGSRYNCHDDGSSETTRSNGRYGNYKCDAPWTLVTSAVTAMHDILPDPDFILWTGDSVPHVPDDLISPTKVFQTIGNVTDLLRDVFPNVTILPSLGNHDAWPANQVPLSDDEYYRDMLETSGWGSLLNEDSSAAFNKGGFYSVEIRPGIRLISLNTILWYEQNHFAFNRPDPANQLAWLEQQLEAARKGGLKVLIAGHIPPGMLARVAHFSWYVPQFNTRLLAMLQDYHDVITAFITGHEHTDGFHIINARGGSMYTPLVPVLMAPAVTPWRSSIPGMGANNPAIRYYTYDRATGMLLDINQYSLNLTAANINHKPEWTLEYQATAAYNVSAVTADDLNTLVSNFLRADDNYFKKYFSFNTAGYNSVSECVDVCKQMHICAIMFVDYDQYQNCMQKYERQHLVPYKVVHNDDGTPHGSEKGENITSTRVGGAGGGNLTHLYHVHPPHPYPPGPRPPVFHHRTPGYMHYVIYSLVGLVLLLFLLIALLCCCFRPKNRMVYFTQPRYVLVS